MDVSFLISARLVFQFNFSFIFFSTFVLSVCNFMSEVLPFIYLFIHLFISFYFCFLFTYRSFADFIGDNYCIVAHLE